MFARTLLPALVGAIACLATAAVAEDTTRGAPKPPPSQSAYTPKDKAGAASPTTKAPPAKDKDGAPASSSGK